MKIDKDIFMKEQRSRNLGLITKEEQELISNTTLLIAGCGVGSQIAMSAARIGFEKFIIVDGDTVEISNLNRQGYTWRDIGKKKVDALARRIKDVNPHAKVKRYPVFVDQHNAEKMTRKADIIIDTIDPDASIAVLALHRAVRKDHKYIIQPSDLGWGACMYIFDPHSISYEEMIGLDRSKPLGEIDQKEAFDKMIADFMRIMPDYLKPLVEKLMKGEIEHYPQPVTAAYVLTAMVVTAAKRIALGLPLVLAPKYISFDPNLILDPKYEKK